MVVLMLAFRFPEWQPHFSFPAGPQTNEMIALRWLHIIFGIIWIGLLYFFNLVLTPAMKQCDPKLRIKMYPELMPGAMAWFRWSALVTVREGAPIRTRTARVGSERMCVAAVLVMALAPFAPDAAKPDIRPGPG